VPFDLDDARQIAAADPAGMLGHALSFHSQVLRAMQIPLPIPRRPKPPANVLISGMGGSGISGRIVEALFRDQVPIPLVARRSRNVPAWVGEDTLFFAVSYSGNTRETIGAAAAAGDAGARVICFTKGGRLAEMATRRKWPWVRLAGEQPPRTALGYLLIPIVRYLAAYNLIGPQDAAIRQVAARVRRLAKRYGPDVAAENNPAKTLAVRLLTVVPVIYGFGEWAGVAAERWKGQLNENAKIHAFANVIPEMNHNEILAWDAEGQPARFGIIPIRDADLDPEMSIRYNHTLAVPGAERLPDVIGDGESELGRLVSACYLGDFVSIYLAFLHGVDPAEMQRIEVLKADLDKLGGS
jgi:glucose/mannose-6-phosphate isomerase